MAQFLLCIAAIRPKVAMVSRKYFPNQSAI
jgi:hypothetical protein